MLAKYSLLVKKYFCGQPIDPQLWTAFQCPLSRRGAIDLSIRRGFCRHGQTPGAQSQPRTIGMAISRTAASIILASSFPQVVIIRCGPASLPGLQDRVEMPISAMPNVSMSGRPLCLSRFADSSKSNGDGFQTNRASIFWVGYDLCQL